MSLIFENLKNKKFIMAGPNVIESEEQVLMMATKLKNIFSNYNVNFIFKLVLIKLIEQVLLLIED